MQRTRRTVVTGTGSYLPSRTMTNEDFRKARFHDAQGEPFEDPPETIIEKFERITGIT